LKGVFYSLSSNFKLDDQVNANNSSQVKELFNEYVRTNNISNLQSNVSSNSELSWRNDSVDKRLGIILKNKQNLNDFNFLIRKTNKYPRYQNHVTINKLHKTNQTTLKSLLFENFPLPCFRHKQNYIDKFNKVIYGA
jgi:hypothetical protein